MSKEALLAQYEHMKHLSEFPESIKYVGYAPDVYPEAGLHPECRLDIWESAVGVRIATHDFGNNHCAYACEGTEEIIVAYYAAMDQKDQAEIANPGDQVSFPEHYEKNIAHRNPNIHLFGFCVTKSTEKGIEVHGIDGPFPHDAYRVDLKRPQTK